MSRRLALLFMLGGLAAATAPAPAAAQSGPVLVVGDSLEVGTGPQLRRELASVPVTVDARTGRPSAEGVRVLRERFEQNHEVVVFDLGTNDDPSQSAAFRRNLEAVRGIVGDRCLIVSTLARPPVNGVSVDAMNRTVRDFVDASPNARLADWEGAVEGEPGLLAPDDVHATPEGYGARARLMAGAVAECFEASDEPRRERQEAPQSEPGPLAKVSGDAPRRSLVDLLALSPFAVFADYVRGAADVVIVAGQNVGGALGQLPEEVELGAPKPGR